MASLLAPRWMVTRARWVHPQWKRGVAAVCGAALAVAAVVGGTVAYRGTGSTPPPSATTCGADPMAHIYHPQRLTILKPCITVEGVIASIKREPDGDDHIRLTVTDKSLINAENISGQHGDLVLEPVCEHTVTQTDAVDACAGYTSDVTVPPVGSAVKVTGPWVLDTVHGWQEIHPAITIEVVP